MTIGNVALATLAGGPFGCWYYFGPRASEGTGGMMPKNPTLTAFARASTLSLGSIAFGSLIVTILEVIRLILQALRNNLYDSDHRECSSWSPLPFDLASAIIIRGGHGPL